MKQQDIKTTSILEKLRDIKEKDLPPITQEQQRKISMALRNEQSSSDDGLGFQDDDIISHSDAGKSARGHSSKVKWYISVPGYIFKLIIQNEQPEH